MSDRNATASWSGYSHQGQVGLLVALRKMQEIGVNLNTHYVLFETHEDVAIYEEPVAGGTPTYHSAHQVKAYYSDTSMYKSTYKKVLNDAFEPGNIRYLHTVEEISDWVGSTTPNANRVERYPYTATQFHCGTGQIETFVREELVKILGAHPQSIVDNAYQRLTFELDHRIRTEHQKKHKHLFDIKFSLQEINDLIRSTQQFAQKEIFECRKLFYDTYRDLIKDGTLAPERVTFLETTIFKPINALSDLEFQLLLQRMNLNHTAERLKSAPIYYNHDGLKQVFFKMLTKVLNTDPSIAESVVQYIRPGHGTKFVLTAIIEDEEDKQSVVENILTNLTSQNLLWERHALVNRSIEINLVDGDPAFHAVGTPEEIANDKNKFMFFAGSKLIKREQALTELNDGGTA